ncbi:hypothetical protein ABIA40_000347 [Bradyrhizobium sp. USDA 223]
MISIAQVTALAASHGWVGKCESLLRFRPPGNVKSPLVAAIGLRRRVSGNCIVKETGLPPRSQ